MYIQEPPGKVAACIIWLHGLGADANDMASLANQLPVDGIRHIFLNAPVRPVTINNGLQMRAWYDIYSLSFTREEDKVGILASATDILQAIDTQIQQGLGREQIFLAGFSQGGAMALHTGLSLKSLGGIIALSAYLPLAAECNPLLSTNTPIFFAYGIYDQIVLPAWSKLTVDWLQLKGYTALSCYDYPMEHNICLDEIKDLTSWLTRLLTGGT